MLIMHIYRCRAYFLFIEYIGHPNLYQDLQTFFEHMTKYEWTKGVCSTPSYEWGEHLETTDNRLAGSVSKLRPRDNEYK